MRGDTTELDCRLRHRGPTPAMDLAIALPNARIDKYPRTCCMLIGTYRRGIAEQIRRRLQAMDAISIGPQRIGS
ncbi:MAG: hypothetical protein NTV29_11190 [Planctomycetota bacterium]|nr:hypothetical protein [Planctomycetota bacterium]